MECMGHAHMSGHLEQQLMLIFTLVKVVQVHLLELEISTSVMEMMHLMISFGLEKIAQVIIHAAHSTTLHTSVYNSLQQPLTGLSYESTLTKD